MPVTTRLIEVINHGERAALFTVISGDAIGARLLVLENGDRVGDGVVEPFAARAKELIRSGQCQILEIEGARVFVEVYGPPPRLFVYGAVDTAQSLCAAARLLGWRTIVADARAAFVTAERIPDADQLIEAWPEEALAEVAPDYATAIVVLTHDEKFDVPALRAALDTEAFYIGALGSRHSQQHRRERLREAGVREESLDRIAAPCGLDIGASSQPETALSILAEVIAARANRDGGRLVKSEHRIHAPGR